VLKKSVLVNFFRTLLVGKDGSLWPIEVKSIGVSGYPLVVIDETSNFVTKSASGNISVEIP
jgi:hypothetical protein